jgi:hypothetical protein
MEAEPPKQHFQAKPGNETHEINEIILDASLLGLHGLKLQRLLVEDELDGEEVIPGFKLKVISSRVK